MQRMSHQRWCSGHFCKARGGLGNGSEKSMGVYQLERRAIEVSSSTPHDPNSFLPL